PGRHRIGEGRERDAVPPAADPGAQRTQRDRSPNAQAAFPDLEDVHRVLAGPEVLVPVRRDVVEAAADQTERNGPDRDVDDVAVPAATGHPPPSAQPDRDHDPRDDAQRVRAQRERPDVPDTSRRAWNGGQESTTRSGNHGTHGTNRIGRATNAGNRPGRRSRAQRERTPLPSSAASSATPSGPCSSARATNAEPEITPSEKDATSAACCCERTPRPTQIGRSVWARVRCTSFAAASPTWSRAPVTPMTEVA